MKRVMGSALQRPLSFAEEEEQFRNSDAELLAEADTSTQFRKLRVTSPRASPRLTSTATGKYTTSASKPNANKTSSDVAKCPFSGASRHDKDTAKSSRCPFARLHVVGNTHQVSDASENLLKFIGGTARLNRSISRFYAYAFANPHLARFFRDTSDPHALRLATWIAEKMGDKNLPWTRERRSRDLTPVVVAGGRRIVVRDRSSAHVAAWHSPKREPHKVGQHFKLDDCRLWLRLNFLAAREEGLFKHKNFKDWYTRFLGHFVRVYERTAPQFVKEAVRWSEDKKRVARYHEAVAKGLPEAPGDGVIGVSLGQALQQIPKEEWAANSDWPYEQ